MDLMPFAAVCAALLAQVRTAQEGDLPVLTFDDLRAAGITAFVDKEFIIVGSLSWESPAAKIPEDRRTATELAAIAGPIKVRIDGKSAEGLAGKAGVLLVSDRLTKAAGTDGVEQWSFNGRRLARDGTLYQLRVRLLLRASFKKELLQKPAFVRQSLQPRYWSQTFEMELLGVKSSGEGDSIRPQ
jgi:hypothetical protein